MFVDIMKIRLVLFLFSSLICCRADPSGQPYSNAAAKLTYSTAQAKSQHQDSESGGLGIVAAVTQRLARWLSLGSDGGQNSAQGTVVPQDDLKHSGSEPRQAWAAGQGKRKSKCNPCNSVPWVPVGRAIGYVHGSNQDAATYSLQIPTISLTAVPIHYGPPDNTYLPVPSSSYIPPKPAYGPPKPEYGPPKPEYGPPKPEYGPPKPDYGPPKPEYGSPNPEYGLPKQEYGNPKPDYGPPKPEYGPPKPEYGPPTPEYGPPKPEYGPPKAEYGPPTPEYGPPKPEYGPPKPEYGPPKPEYGPPKPEYGPPKPEYGPPKPEYGPPKPEYGPPKSEYGPPKPEYGPPKPEYGPPKPEYGPPPLDFSTGSLDSSHLGQEYNPGLIPPKPIYGIPKPNFHSTSEFGPPNLEYGPPKPEYGPPKPEYGPPMPEYGPPKPDYGPPKPEYGPPLDQGASSSEQGPPPQALSHEVDSRKPNPTHGGFNGNDYGSIKTEVVPPKPDYGQPKPNLGPSSSQQYVSHKPDYSRPSSDIKPPKSDHNFAKQPFRPPKQDVPVPTANIVPPKPPYSPVKDYVPLKPGYLPAKPQNGATKPGYVPGKVQHGHPGAPWMIMRPPRPYMFISQKPLFISPSATQVRNPSIPSAYISPPPQPSAAQQTQQQSASHQSLSYDQYLTPPPPPPSQHSQQQRIKIHQPLPFPELSQNPLPPLHPPTPFGNNLQQPIKSHSNVVVTISESEQSCNKCPPSGPDLSLHKPVQPEEAKNVIGNFANLPLSDSAHEASSSSHTVSSLIASPTSKPSTFSTPPESGHIPNVKIIKSIPLYEILSSVEYPMQIIQAPILDVPELPKYFDVGYHSFAQHLQPNRHTQPVLDNEKSASINTASVAVNLPPNNDKSGNIVHNSSKFYGDAVSTTAPSNIYSHRQHFDTLNPQDGTYYETLPSGNGHLGWTGISSESITPPRPFSEPNTSTTSQKKTKQIHQIIVPYTTVKKPPQARKVPSDPVTNAPDLQTIYVNNGHTSPGNIPTNINYALTATASENLETQAVPSEAFIHSLPPDVLNKLLEVGIINADHRSGDVQQILATNIRALLEGEEDSVDLARLQKNIDKWTVEGFGKRETVGHQVSKKIPEEYFTTSSPLDTDIQETKMPNDDHETAASQHYHVSYKNSNSIKDISEFNETDLIGETDGWSLIETKIKTTTEIENDGSSTQKPWEKLEVSISPLTNEKVYVVTPVSAWPSGPANNETSTATNFTTVDAATIRPGNLNDTSTDKVTVITAQPIKQKENHINNDNTQQNELEPGEIQASVQYLGSASSLSSSKVEFRTTR